MSKPDILWTEKEDNLIKELFPHTSTEEVVSCLNTAFGKKRTYNAVKRRAHILKVKRSKEMRKILFRQFMKDHPEVTEKMRQTKIKNFKDPKERKKLSEIVKKMYREKPEVRKKMSEAKKKYYKKHPEALERLSHIRKEFNEKNPGLTKKVWGEYIKIHPEHNEKQSQKLKKFYEVNPGQKEVLSKSRFKYLSSHPEFHEEQSIRKKNYFFWNPDARTEQSKRMKKYFDDHPEQRELVGKQSKELMKKGLLKKMMNASAKTGRYGSKPQKHIKNYLSLFFGEDAVILNDHEVLNGMEIDVFIPSYKIAIEFNGYIHYTNYYKTGSLKKRQKRDKIKKEKLESKGYHFIVVEDIEGKLSLREIEIILDEELKKIIPEYKAPQHKII